MKQGPLNGTEEVTAHQYGLPELWLLLFNIINNNKSCHLLPSLFNAFNIGPIILTLTV